MSYFEDRPNHFVNLSLVSEFSYKEGSVKEGRTTINGPREATYTTILSSLTLKFQQSSGLRDLTLSGEKADEALGLLKSL